MKQRIKKLFTHYALRITHHGSGGFTLIELAMVLVVVPIL
jgi:prepilin-type N-terminal cleavage/methylation domain-containing protein